MGQFEHAASGGEGDVLAEGGGEIERSSGDHGAARAGYRAIEGEDAALDLENAAVGDRASDRGADAGRLD